MMAESPRETSSGLMDDSCVVMTPDAKRPDTRALVALLNRLYVLESTSFFRYLDTWTPYTSAKTIRLRSLCRKISAASLERAERLSELITALGGNTGTGGFQQDAAFSNYGDWASLLPRLIESQQEQLAALDQAIETAPKLPGADDRVLSTLREFRTQQAEEITALREWVGRA